MGFPIAMAGRVPEDFSFRFGGFNFLSDLYLTVKTYNINICRYVLRSDILQKYEEILNDIALKLIIIL